MREVGDTCSDRELYEINAARSMRYVYRDGEEREIHTETERSRRYI
jgi:hypothetical protein